MSSPEEGRSSGLNWAIERQQGLITVRLRGELDLSSAAALQPILERTISASPVTVVDLEGLEFMDSTGLRLFAHIHQMTGESGARFLLGRPSPAVLRVLQVAGLVEHFDYVEGAPPSERTCSVCGERVPATGTRCPHCGGTI
jgi:anti-anti-sigma factor